MSEVFSQNYEDINNKEGIKEQNIPSFNDLENNIAQNYENNSTREGAQNIALNQYKEQQQLKDQIESPILQETREQLYKEAMINEAKIMLYEKLGIYENQENNNILENFIKGVIDGGILDNYDLAIQVWETNGKIILDGLEQLASWEGLKQIAKSIGEDIWSLLTGNAYEKGKVSAEIVLILLTSGAGLALNTTRKGIKLGIKEISKLRLNKERLVKNIDVKEVIGSVNNKISEIIPKKQLDFEKAVVEDIAKLGDKDRINAGKFYLKKDITPEQQQAIIKAHNVGKDRDGAGIYNYNQAEILEKSRILKEAGFSKEERKILLEKGVCGKEYNNTLADNLQENQLRQLKEKLYINKQIKGLEKLGIPESFSKDLLESGILTPLPNIEKFNLLKRYEFFNKRGVNYEKMLSDGIEKIKKQTGNILTKEEALLIFSYTDYFLYGKLNTFKRGDKKLLSSMTKENIDATNRIITKLEIALEKMPDLKPGKDGFILRGDKWEGRIYDNNGIELKKYDEIELKSLTSVSNNGNDILLGELHDNNIFVEIIGKEGKIKDISSFATFVNFWKELNKKQTHVEGVILPNSTMRFIKKANIIMNAPNKNNELVPHDIISVEFEQIK